MRTGFIILALAAATVLLRTPLLSPRLAHWDAVNYALGLHHFDIAAHQPHPPGSPYFIALGRAVLLFVADDNRALQTISIGASAAAVVAEYALARRLFGPAAGLLAALVLLTQPIFWGYGTTATAWTLLACASIATVLICLQLVRGALWLIYPSALFLGVVSGFRADAAVFLAPVWLWALTRATPAWRTRLRAVSLLAASGLVWLIPITASAGGVDVWLSRVVALLPTDANSGSAVVRQLAVNTVISVGTLALVAGPLVALSFAMSRACALGWWRDTVRSRMVVFWGLAIAPAFIFLWLIDSTEPGHGLVFIGTLIACGAGMLAHSARRQSRIAVCGALLVAVQTVVFLLAPTLSDRPLAWTLDSMFLNVTATGLRQQQNALDTSLSAIRARFDPRTTVIVTLVGQDPYRFMMYYLPEFTVVRLDPQAHAVLMAHNRVQGNWIPAADCPPGEDATRAVVWVLSPPDIPGTIPEDATPLSGGSPVGAFQVWYRDGPTTVPEYMGFNFAPGGCAPGQSVLIS